MNSQSKYTYKKKLPKWKTAAGVAFFCALLPWFEKCRSWHSKLKYSNKTAIFPNYSLELLTVLIEYIDYLIRHVFSPRSQFQKRLQVCQSITHDA